MRRGLAVAALAAGVFVIAGVLLVEWPSDLRPPELVAAEPTPGDQRRGRAILERMWEVHGGPATVGVQVVESVATHDIALAPYRWIFGAWPHNPQELRGFVVLGTDDSQVHAMFDVQRIVPRPELALSKPQRWWP